MYKLNSVTHGSAITEDIKTIIKLTERKIIIPGEKIVDSGDFLPGEGTEKRDDGIYALRFGLARNIG